MRYVVYRSGRMWAVQDTQTLREFGPFADRGVAQEKADLLNRGDR